MQNSDKAGWGAIFDFDGVVVNTEWHHEVCWQQVAKERNQSITHEQYVNGFGVKNDRFILEILRWTDDPEEIGRIAARKEAIFLEHAKQHQIDLVAGLDAFLHILEKHQVPCAIASSSILKNIEILLEKSPVHRFFSKIVSGEDVTHGKPHPECFLNAAKKLELPPDRCVVFEDALLGVEGAKRAGTKIVALTTTFDRTRFEELPFKVDLIANTFEDIDFYKVQSWFR